VEKVNTGVTTRGVNYDIIKKKIPLSKNGKALSRKSSTLVYWVYQELKGGRSKPGFRSYQQFYQQSIYLCTCNNNTA